MLSLKQLQLYISQYFFTSPNSQKQIVFFFSFFCIQTDMAEHMKLYYLHQKMLKSKEIVNTALK